MGATLERMGRSAEAAAQYRAALRLEPNEPEALAGLARASGAKIRSPRSGMER
jgi:Flp pilus assembly protein TadD